MSRTKRFDRYSTKIVPDGKVEYIPKRLSTLKRKFIKKWAWKDDAQYRIDSSSDAMEFYHPEKQEYLKRHFDA